ncbi:MAG: mechanosensitive ion channel family protein [Methanosarcinaceae archaeon]|nr:mechanosensitive ion channel family protein [Methanosarcinaceae archaeon]
MNVTDPTAVVSSISAIGIKVLLSIATIIIAVVIGKVISIRLRRSLKEKINKGHLDIIIKIVQYSFIIFVLLIFVLPILGVQPSSLLVAGSIAGLVIGFASQSIVSNLISGLFLMIERPIKVGDNVNINGILGIVEDISIISTIIRNYDGLYIRIPNEAVFTNTITNYVANVARRFEYVVGIRYSDDADKAIGIIKELIEAHPFALKSPVPQAFVDNLGDNSVNIIVRIWSPSTEWYGVKMELLWEIKKILGENGIEIAFPQRVMWFANELKKEVD